VIQYLLENSNTQSRIGAVFLARTYFCRLKGLLFSQTKEPILLEPCSSVHTCGMREPIDVIFLDKNRTVLKVLCDVRPWRLAAHPNAHSVLEFFSGTWDRSLIKVGDQLKLQNI
jgi:uncharacterized protein